VFSVGSMNYIGALPIDNYDKRRSAIDHQYRQNALRAQRRSMPREQPTSEDVRP